MRILKTEGDFRAKAIAGTHTVLIALDCDEARRHGLMGFAFKRETVGAENAGPKWLRSLKVFKSIVPNPKQIEQKRFSTWEHPIHIDPLSDDPLVCSGSANFSSNSLLQNDENMLLIRGDTRVADIYLTEFDRIFRHFYFRDVANEIEAAGNNAEGAFLYETSK